MMKICKYCKKSVEFQRDESGLLYCPECGFYEEEEVVMEDNEGSCKDVPNKDCCVSPDDKEDHCSEADKNDIAGL